MTTKYPLYDEHRQGNVPCKQTTHKKAFTEAMEQKLELISLVQPGSQHFFTVPAHDTDHRLDVYLRQLFPSYSRNFLQELITTNNVLVNGKAGQKTSYLTRSGDELSVTFPPIPVMDQPREVPTDLRVGIVHIDEHFMIINKPPYLSVHPPKLNSKEATLVDWLIKTFNDIKDVGFVDRPGIVHRLDKDTSGILLVARNNCAHALLSEKFKNRDIQKTYLAIAKGHPDPEGTITYAITRHPTKRNTMTHVDERHSSRYGSSVRSARTDYKVLEYFDNCSLVEAKPFTGRTHQIRVHFAAIGHPLIGDLMYGDKSKEIGRQALHAHKLAFEFNGKLHEFTQNPPDDFENLLQLLRDKKTKIST